MTLEQHRPVTLLVMEERRRDEVYPKVVREELESLTRWREPLTREQLAADPSALDGVEVLLSGWGAPVLDSVLLGHATSLRAVLVAAGSVRPLTTPEFWAREIPIVSAASANAIPVAEFTLAQILLGLKQVHRIARELRERQAYPPDPPVPGGYRSKVGLLGLGEIGALVASHLRNFDVEVLATDPVVDAATAADLGVRLVDLGELFASCSVVSLHAPLLPETEGLVNGDLVATLEPGATLINTARGAVVDEPSVLPVLAERQDLTAILDVTFPEPPVAGSLLYTLPNVVLTPHLAGALSAERGRMGELVTAELRRLILGHPLQHAVAPAAAHLRA
ncbi:Phosphoglycerate dehydrogenase [Amycolatopsis xylanica]|uniref:Phosphoglycerate dehydrogenase n=1 Tax=Amycolatopsis xylanica TaxID=589385 RepID=A0A1H2TUA4_9PSEU|nr:hydroxyacid dehydrogenase [Amycolatopsis xylanica]SDW47430.1 Phosphoglycerate dehydrogenase [Amycolatopsis xylanica]